MSERNHGLIIEGFVQGSYNLIFENKIEVRHHPLTSWAQATVSGSQTGFQTTKDHVLRTLNGVQHTLHHVGGNDELLNELGEFEMRLQESQSVVDLGNTIDEASSILDRAFNRQVSR
ncbi:hypothetical protein ACEN9F_11080 [Duganella sp. CT11-25]|uniref:hypothetical protein n=1 Tax=unclassified Duganella TaxID=2636909 RepID=UPI0039B08422